MIFHFVALIKTNTCEARESCPIEVQKGGTEEVKYITYS